MNHLEFAAIEASALRPSAWEIWVDAVERMLSHDLDGDDAENGYSLDSAYIAWEQGQCAASFASDIKSRAHYTVRLYSNGSGFSPKAANRMPHSTATTRGALHGE
jgi:hypothetical protein